MKLIIDIPDLLYYHEIEQASHNNSTPIEKAIAQGTVLPEVHGDLISRNALKEEIAKRLKEPNYLHENEDWQNGLCIAETLIDNAPTIDLKDIYQEGHYDGQLEGYTKAINEERPQGEWIEVGDNQPYSKDKLYGCSKCRFGGYLLSDTKNVNFCPNCGADMRGEYDKQ